MDHNQEVINSIIAENPYEIRLAKRRYLYGTAFRAVKWAVIGAGVIAIAGAVTNRNKNEEQEEN